MTETTTPQDVTPEAVVPPTPAPAETLAEAPAGTLAEAPAEEMLPPKEIVIEDSLMGGRPIEDRSFEVVEAGIGAAFGAAIGTAVMPGIGTAVGGVVGGAIGFGVGEALERHEGKVARTIDAVDDEGPAEG